MSEHPIESMMGTTMDKIKEMADVNTVIGDPITTEDGTVIIPISKVSYGFASGGSDLPSKTQPNRELFGGGAGAGVTITPIAFLTVSNGNVRLLQLDPFNSSVDRIIGMAPGFMDAVTGLLNKNKKQKEAEKASKVVEEAQKTDGPETDTEASGI